MAFRLVEEAKIVQPVNQSPDVTGLLRQLEPLCQQPTRPGAVALASNYVTQVSEPCRKTVTISNCTLDFGALFEKIARALVVSLATRNPAETIKRKGNPRPIAQYRKNRQTLLTQQASPIVVSQ